jgi:hypothetical protein
MGYQSLLEISDIYLKKGNKRRHFFGVDYSSVD